jgi:hypothetical protein
MCRLVNSNRRSPGTQSLHLRVKAGSLDYFISKVKAPHPFKMSAVYLLGTLAHTYMNRPIIIINFGDN